MKKVLSQFLLLISFLSVSISPVVAQTWFNGLDVYDTAVNWINVKAVKNQASYSQILCSRATPRAQYGLGVYNPFPEHVRGKNTIVKVSGFVKIPGENSSGLYVVTLEKYGKTVSDLIRRALDAFIETEMAPENVEKKVVDLPKSSVKVLEDLTEQGEYVSVEDAIRAVIRDYVKKAIKENEGEKE
jgi:Arc/MetJ-type ribon-helix-helix transcriptional regulator